MERKRRARGKKKSSRIRKKKKREIKKKEKKSEKKKRKKLPPIFLLFFFLQKEKREFDLFSFYPEKSNDFFFSVTQPRLTMSLDDDEVEHTFQWETSKKSVLNRCHANYLGLFCKSELLINPAANMNLVNGHYELPCRSFETWVVEFGTQFIMEWHEFVTKTKSTVSVVTGCPTSWCVDTVHAFGTIMSQIKSIRPSLYYLLNLLKGNGQYFHWFETYFVLSFAVYYDIRPLVTLCKLALAFTIFELISGLSTTMADYRLLTYFNVGHTETTKK